MSNNKKNILFFMSGSIACFKSCDLLSQLVKQGHQVQVATTSNAQHFIGHASLEGLSGKPVLCSSFQVEKSMEHIHLNKWADLIIFSPATAKSINLLASGTGEGFIFDFFLAFDFKKPFYIFPAMNTKMFQHPSTKRSIDLLKDWGLKIAPVGTGKLACGDQGPGRLIETPEALKILSEVL